MRALQTVLIGFGLLASAAMALLAPFSAQAQSRGDYSRTIFKSSPRKIYSDDTAFMNALVPIAPLKRYLRVDDVTMTYTMDAGKSFTVPITERKASVIGASGPVDGVVRIIVLEKDNNTHKNHNIHVATLFPDTSSTSATGLCTATTSWEVPIQRRGKSILLDGLLNGTATIRWMLDTGASMSSIPVDVAKRLGTRVIDHRDFELADGSIVRSPIVIINKLQVGNVSIGNIQVAVTDYGTDALLGKNFLDAFSSYEINNARSQLVLRK